MSHPMSPHGLGQSRRFPVNHLARHFRGEIAWGVTGASGGEHEIESRIHRSPQGLSHFIAIGHHLWTHHIETQLSQARDQDRSGGVFPDSRRSTGGDREN